MIGAHTDSPTLRIKPVSKKQSDGFVQVGVETYGGGLWHTWFDRDLGIAGRVMIRNAAGGYEQKLVKIDRPTGLVAAELNRAGSKDDPATPEVPDNSAGSDSFTPLKAANERHHPHIVEIIAKEAGVDPSSVVDFEMILFDTQGACIGGLNEELIFSARLDNLGMSFCGIMGLVNSLASPSALEDENCIRLVALFDHEEIGSTTAQGADSNLLPAIVRRLSFIGSSSNKTTTYEQTLSTSFLISADMAHSVNPNYSSKYEPDHRPEMNKGTVIKINANARYATNAPGIVLLQEVARRQKVPLQLFVVRNDSSCGSTIGPMLAAALGARTIDLGNPQLSMHSIRETGGVYDVEYAIRLFEGFFEHFGQLEGSILVD
ncbi:MAG: hypothetical protein Q9167_001961 [Letrouitia subvulpina]